MENSAESGLVEVKSLDIASCVRVAMILYGLMGLLFGGLVSLFALFGSMIGSGSGDTNAPFMGVLNGVGAIVVFPVCYAVMGAITAGIGAALYNMCAQWVGGINVVLGSPRVIVRPHDAPPN